MDRQRQLSCGRECRLMRTKTVSSAVVLLLATLAVHAQQVELRIRAARVLDGTGQVLDNATIVVRGSTIAAIESSSSKPVISIWASRHCFPD